MHSNIPLNGTTVNPLNGAKPFSGHGAAPGHNAGMGSQKGKPKRVRRHPVNNEVNKKQIAGNLQRIMEDYGRGKDAFAEALGLPVSTLNKWLCGVSYPQGDGVLQLASMGYDPRFLFLGIGSMHLAKPKRPAETEQEPQKMAVK
jgi:DNA-binding transcriptional regulator YiaG